MAAGPKPPSHNKDKSGLEVGVRPLRKDGHEELVKWWDQQFDEAAAES